MIWMGLLLCKPQQYRSPCRGRGKRDSKLQIRTSWRLGTSRSQDPAPHCQTCSRCARAVDAEGTNFPTPQGGSKVENWALLFLRPPKHLNGQNSEFASFSPITVKQESLLSAVRKLRWWYMWTLSCSIPSGAISWTFFCSARAQSNAWAVCSSEYITIAPEISL